MSQTSKKSYKQQIENAFGIQSLKSKEILQEVTDAPNVATRNFNVVNSISMGEVMNPNNGRAFEQKEILGNYYTGVPAFMRSEGPFEVYNHHKIKGSDHHDKVKMTKTEAKLRV